MADNGHELLEKFKMGSCEQTVVKKNGSIGVKKGEIQDGHHWT